MGKGKGRNIQFLQSPAKVIGATNNDRIEKLEHVVRDFQGQINNILGNFDNRLKRVELDVGNAYDLINAQYKVSKLKYPSKEKFQSFYEKLEVPYIEMDEVSKLNSLLSYLKISLIFFSDCPTHMSSTSGPFTEMKFEPDSFAIALARRVFPVPGGP